jgi:hypothetical protein
MNTQSALDRAYAHWLKDGLFEIGAGILLAGVGALRAILHFVPKGSATYYWLAAGLFVFMGAYIWGAQRVGRALKARLTYPRTGYAAFKPRTYTIRSILALVALLILAGVLGAMVGVLATQPDQQRVGTVVPIAMGLVGALALARAARRFEVNRYYYLGAFSIGLGFALGALGVGVVLGLSLFYLGIGLALALTGCVALVQYLRTHEPVHLNGAGQ